MSRNEYWQIVNDLDPGDLLDHLVAERVMGWLIHLRNTAWYVKAGDEGKVVDTIQHSVKEWHPSTNIGQAWRVLEAVKAHGTAIQINIHKEDVLIICSNFNTPSPQARITAATTPEAICKMALLEAEWRKR